MGELLKNRLPTIEALLQKFVIILANVGSELALIIGGFLRSKLNQVKLICKDLDLATRSFSDQVKQLLTQLLNEANVYVQEAHDSQRGLEILEGKDTLPLLDKNSMDVEFDEKTGNRLATTVSDAMSRN